MSEQRPTNIQKAVQFFRQPVWERLLAALYERYIREGRIAGQVILADCTLEERREIARLLQKRWPEQSSVTVRLSDFQQALTESNFACELPTLLKALFPERSHITRSEQRERRVHAHERFYAALSALAAGLPDDSRGKRWWLSGPHGQEALFRRYKNEAAERQEQILYDAALIVQALDHLPLPPQRERLALFAQRISGDPHRLDANTFSGRLFLHALTDLASLQPNNSTTPRAKNAEGLPQETLALTQEQDQERLYIYYEAGLLLDTISSTVAVFHLALAQSRSGQSDLWLAQAGKRVLILPLRELLTWEKLLPASKHVYLFENPQVFEEVVDQLQQTSQARRRTRALPTLICTSGWLSIAALELLNLLTSSLPEITLHYSGDFDIPGLRIAAHLLARYPQHCQLWRFDPASYLSALHTSASPLTESDLAGLHTLPEMLTPLIATMHTRGQKAYQEGITSLLLKDIEQMEEDTSIRCSPKNQ